MATSSAPSRSTAASTKTNSKNKSTTGFTSFATLNPRPARSGPLIPGDPEREAEAIRSKEGIPLLQAVVDDLLDISKKTGIPFEVK